MTDRVNALLVVLDHDVRIDDVEPLIQAIKQLRGVVSVTPNIVDTTTLIAEARADNVWRERLLDLIRIRP